jgi:hypothetical protein
VSLTVIIMLLSAAPTEGQRLFEEGRVAFKAGDLVKACPTFEKSYALEPTLGSLLNLATCFEKQGRLASSWIRFNDAIAWAQRTHESEREQFARKHAQDLKPRVSWLALTAAEELEATVDGQPVRVGRIAIAVPVDPGPHELAVVKPGYGPYRASVSVGSGATAQHAIPALGVLVAPSADAPVATAQTGIEPIPWVAPPQPPPVVADPGAVAAPVEVRHASAPNAGVRFGCGRDAVGCRRRGGAGRGRRPGVELPHQRAAAEAALEPSIGGSTPWYISREEVELMQWLYPASWAAVGVGVAALGVGTVLLAGQKVAITPSIQPGGASVSVTGQF